MSAETPGKDELAAEDAVVEESSTEAPAVESPPQADEATEAAADAQPSQDKSDVAEAAEASVVDAAAPAAAVDEAESPAEAAGEASAPESSEEPDAPAEAPMAEAAEETTEAEDAAPESAGDPDPPAASEPEPKPAEEPAKFHRGQICVGRISSTSPTAVNIDLGDGDTGVVPGRELELMTRKMLESLSVGAEVDVFVVNPRNHRGEIVLSINHALEEKDWRNAEEFAKSRKVHEALIGGYNKGGLIVRFGRLRGFVPQSQLSESRVRGATGETPEERYGPMVNQPIGVKVMEVDRSRNRLILSERAALREVRRRRKKALIDELTVGEVRRGKVVSLESFGAFVDIGGAEGLVHVTELAWGHVTSPRQVVQVGEELDVEVISVDAKARRIGLSRRRTLRDPWDDVATSLRRGQLVRGRVTKLTKFGAFARLIDNDAVEGLIHISELSNERVTHPREVVNRGDELALRIVKIDIKERRLGLSLKSVKSTEYLDLDWEMAIQDSASLPEPAAPSKPPSKPPSNPPPKPPPKTRASANNAPHPPAPSPKHLGGR